MLKTGKIMHNNPVWLKVVASLLFVSIFFLSCNTERYAGKTYVKKLRQDSVPILFIGADYLFKTNSHFLDTVEGLNEWQRDSAQLAQSILLSQVNDSTILANFNKNFAQMLRAYGIIVYTEDQTTEFLAHNKGAVVSIAQLELEEVFEPYVDSEVFDTLEYFQEFDLTALNINSWIEVAPLDTTVGDINVYYNTNTIKDKIDGLFKQNLFSGDVSYTYKYYEMKEPLVYKFALSSGTLHAMKLFDYWMNNYIRKQFPPEARGSLQYLTYDPKVKGFFTADDKATKIK